MDSSVFSRIRRSQGTIKFAKDEASQEAGVRDLCQTLAEMPENQLKEALAVLSQPGFPAELLQKES